MDNNIPPGFQLDSGPAPAQAAVEAANPIQEQAIPPGFQLDEGPAASIPSGFQLDEQKYGTPGQQALTAVESGAKGYLGPVATLAEKKLSQMGVPGLSPQEQQSRAETNPWLSGLSEAGGFGAGALTGTGEAAVLGKVGEAAKALSGLSKASTIGERLAASAISSAAEMSAFQVGDEASKAINNAPQSVGSVATSIGLSGLIGGALGPVGTSLGMAAHGILDSAGLKDFVDRLAYRKTNIDPNEMVKHEAENVISTYNAMNDEINGPSGIKSQAVQKLLPEEMTPKIQQQIETVLNSGQASIDDMMKKNVPERYIAKLQNDLDSFKSTIDSNPSVNQIFDSMNGLKKTLQDYSKGNWGPFAIPSHHEAYDFLANTKKLGYEIRTALENPNVWGDAATLQKNLNKSWTKALPAAKDFEKKFMVKIGDQPIVSSEKFNTYMNQAGKATSTTDRQKMLGNFINAMDNHFKTVDELYKAAGVENPFPTVGMGTLKESLEKKSTGAKLADLWHDKLGASTLGNAAGVSVGTAIGSTLGHGLGGAYLGKEVLGPIFSNMIRPILERYPNVDVNAFNQAMKYGKSVLNGEKLLHNAVGSLFVGSGKTFPSHVMPTAKELDKLDKQVAKLNGNLPAQAKIPGKLDVYMPNHNASVATTASNAIIYLNQLRPKVDKKLPFDSDSDSQITGMQKAAYKRALQIAEQPLAVIEHVKDGTLTPQDIVTLKTIYPDYYQKIQQTAMEYVVNQVNEGRTLPYKTRMSLSVLTGQSLDSTMEPMAIQAAQPPPPQPQQNQQAPMKGRKGKSAIDKMSDSYKTPSQTAESDRSSRD